VEYFLEMSLDTWVLFPPLSFKINTVFSSAKEKSNIDTEAQTFLNQKLGVVFYEKDYCILVFQAKEYSILAPCWYCARAYNRLSCYLLIASKSQTVIPRTAKVQSCTRTERSEWSSVHCTFLRMENMSSIHCITYPAIDCIWPLIPFAVNPAKSSRYEQRSARQPGQAGSPLQAPSPTRKNVVRKNHTSWADLMKQAIHLKHASTQHQHGVYQCLFICLRHANAYMFNSYHRPTTSVAITIPESYHKRDKIH